MALTRRTLLLSFPVFAALATGCTAPARPARMNSSYTELFLSRPARKSRGTILVCMPKTKQTEEVWLGLSDELGKDFELVAIRLESAEDASLIARGIERHRPSGLVLMNNPTLKAYRQFQQSTASSHFPPAVVVMTSFLDEARRHLEDSTGVSYEVPLITVVTNLRKLIATPIDRVGVVHRARLATFVAREAKLAAREQIRVQGEAVGDAPNASELKRALRRLKQTSDAIWVLNDDRLLSPTLITDGWLPALNERPFKPAIVGAASLVSPDHSFGTFAVLPDHTALGVQAANLIFDLADNEWTIEDGGSTELPLSTTTTVDLLQARERFTLRKDALKQVDRILE